MLLKARTGASCVAHPAMTSPPPYRRWNAGVAASSPNRVAPDNSEEKATPPGIITPSPNPSFRAWTAYFVMRCLSAVLHLSVAFVVLLYWTSVARSDLHARLLTRAYFTTDAHSMLQAISNQGYITAPPVPGAHAHTDLFGVTPHTLTRSGMLSHAQPLMIQYDGLDGSMFQPMGCPFIPDADEVPVEAGAAAHAARAEDVAIWRACMATDVPTRLVDMAYPEHTLTVFGANNMMALLYNTMILTAAISIAMLPPIVPSFNVWVLFSELLLFGNMVAMLCLPFTDAHMHLPINNAALAVVLHLVTGAALLALARPRDHNRPASTPSQDGSGGGSGGGRPGPWMHLRVVGRLRTTGQDLWAWAPSARALATGRLPVFTIAPAMVPTALSPDYRNLENSKSKPVRVEQAEDQKPPLPEGDGHNPTEGADGDAAPAQDHGGLHHVLAVTRNGGAALASKGMLDDDFVGFLWNRTALVMVRFFEYSMTAGLFLVGIMIVLCPNADAYTYQVLYQGMLLCNLVAIPMTKAIVGAVRVYEDLHSLGDRGLHSMYGRWMPAALAMLLLASWAFFVAAFVPFFYTAWPMLTAKGLPAVVVVVVVAIGLMFLGFAIVGTIALTAMAGTVRGLTNDQPNAQAAKTKGEAAKRSVYSWMCFQVIGFEALNFFKWIMALVVVFSVLSEVGLAE